MLQRVADVECERCGDVIRHQIGEHEGSRRWVCPKCLGVEWADWVAQITNLALQNRAA